MNAEGFAVLESDKKLTQTFKTEGLSSIIKYFDGLPEYIKQSEEARGYLEAFRELTRKQNLDHLEIRQAMEVIFMQQELIGEEYNLDSHLETR